MESQLQRVREWMEIGGQTTRSVPTAKIPEPEWRLRRSLMKEELTELLKAMLDNDIVEIADGLADLLYVVLGTAVSYGIDSDAIFDIAHNNNMTKFVKCNHAIGGGVAADPKDCDVCNGAGLRAIHRADGKVLKAPDWKEPTPEIMAELTRQGYADKWLRDRYDHYPQNPNTYPQDIIKEES